MTTTEEPGGLAAHNHRPENGGGVILDTKALDVLLELGGEDPSFVSEVVELFLTDSVIRVDEMSTGLEALEPDRVLRAAHALKSSSAHVGAAEFSRCCGELESLCRSDEQGEDLLLTGRKAVAMYAEVQTALQALIAAR